MSIADPPRQFAWELTLNCNLRCVHCGSSCGAKHPNELSPEEALQLVDQLRALQPGVVALTGGEPLTRPDWHVIAGRLAADNHHVSMMTNGTLVNPETAARIADSGIASVTVSVDGTREFHDRIRGEGCHRLVYAAIRNLKQVGISPSVKTAVMKDNIDDLPNMQRELSESGIGCWGLQLGIARGRLGERPNATLEPEEIRAIVDFSLDVNTRSALRVILSDSIGYFSRQEIRSRQLGHQSAGIPVWDGCHAGVRSMAVFHNGDIGGCLSLRPPMFVEGNVRRQNIVDVWYAADAFSWRRTKLPDDLAGFCGSCGYQNRCRGGCPATRLSPGDRLEPENRICLYRHARLCQTKESRKHRVIQFPDQK
jgi:radical SAM protein with 4Fe4S-binding SPASM domain